MYQTLSTPTIRSGWAETQNRRTLPLIDYEAGGPTLNAPTADRYSVMWVAESDGSSVTVRREDSEEAVEVLTDTGITQIALAFDQTMRPHVAYVAEGVAKFRYWDTLSGDWSLLNLGNAVTPRLCTDEKRSQFIGTEDVILCYMRGEDLFVRYQRDRYLEEKLLEANTNGVSLTTIGMNNANRLQWKIRPKPGFIPPNV